MYGELREKLMDINLKYVVKCKCGLEFNSPSDRAAHIRKQMSFINKAVWQPVGYIAPHSNKSGTYIREKELAVS